MWKKPTIRCTGCFFKNDSFPRLADGHYGVFLLNVAGLDNAGSVSSNSAPSRLSTARRPSTRRRVHPSITASPTRTGLGGLPSIAISALPALALPTTPCNTKRDASVAWGAKDVASLAAAVAPKALATALLSTGWSPALEEVAANTGLDGSCQCKPQ